MDPRDPTKSTERAYEDTAKLLKQSLIVGVIGGACLKNLKDRAAARREQLEEASPYTLEYCSHPTMMNGYHPGMKCIVIGNKSSSGDLDDGTLVTILGTVPGAPGRVIVSYEGIKYNVLEYHLYAPTKEAKQAAGEDVKDEVTLKKYSKTLSLARRKNKRWAESRRPKSFWSRMFG